MIDLTIRGGTLLTMDPARRVIDDAVVVVDGGRVVAVGPRHELDGRYEAREDLDATGQVVMPGLIDTHGHAGHSLTKTLADDASGREWLDLMDHIYFRSTTPDFWLAEGHLGALERLKFGTTTGVAIVGSQPRCDDPVYAGGTAQGYLDVGVRGIVAVGPARAPWPRLMSTWDGEQRRDHEVTLEQALATTEAVIDRWHDRADRRCMVSVMASVLVPSGERDRAVGGTDVSEIDRAQAAGIRRVAADHGVTIHAHCYGDMIRRAYHGGLDVLGPDVSLAHCTGLTDEDIEILRRTGATVAHGPSTRSYIRARCPVPELIDAGVTVGLATDGTAPDRSFDLFAQFRAAMLVHRVHFNDAGYLPPGKVIEMATIDAAATLGLADHLGSIEPGKLADIILVDLAQPHLTPTFKVPHRIAYEASGHDVSTVVVGGEIVMRDRRPTRVDESAVLVAAEREASSMVERADIAHLLDVSPRFWGHAHYQRDIGGGSPV